MEKRLNFITEHNAFERRTEMLTLTSGALAIWYRLFALRNRAGWPEWVSIDNMRLMRVAGIGSEKTLIRDRERLIAAGLIEYRRGGKGKPGRYRLVRLSEAPEGGEASGNAAGNAAGNAGGNAAGNGSDIIKRETDKYKTRYHSAREPYQPWRHHRSMQYKQRTYSAEELNSIGIVFPDDEEDEA